MRDYQTVDCVQSGSTENPAFLLGSCRKTRESVTTLEGVEKEAAQFENFGRWRSGAVRFLFSDLLWTCSQWQENFRTRHWTRSKNTLQEICCYRDMGQLAIKNIEVKMQRKGKEETWQKLTECAVRTRKRTMRQMRVVNKGWKLTQSARDTPYTMISHLQTTA